MIGKILVVCSGNICRSPMAEGILRAKLAERGRRDVTVLSAGTFDIDGAPPSAHAVTARLLDWADIVLGMEEHHLDECRRRIPGSDGPRLRLLGGYARPDAPEIEDPVGRDLEAFRECRDRLFAGAEEFLEAELRSG